MKKNCQLDVILFPIRGKWKAEIIDSLKDGPRRLSEIERDLPDAIHRVVTRQLRGLEKDEIVQRKIYSELPPRVEYSLTEQGKFLCCLLYTINQAAEEYVQKTKRAKRSLSEIFLALI